MGMYRSCTFFQFFARLHAQWTSSSIAWGLPSQALSLIQPLMPQCPYSTYMFFVSLYSFFFIPIVMGNTLPSFPFFSKNDSNNSSITTACLQAWDVGVVSKHIKKKKTPVQLDKALQCSLAGRITPVARMNMRLAGCRACSHIKWGNKLRLQLDNYHYNVWFIIAMRTCLCGIKKVMFFNLFPYEGFFALFFVPVQCKQWWVQIYTHTINPDTYLWRDLIEVIDRLPLFLG